MAGEVTAYPPGHVEGQPPYVKALWSDELLATIQLRDDDCNRIIVDIGEPGPDGFYTPTLTRDYDDNPLTEPLPDWGKMLVDPPMRCLGCYVIMKAFGCGRQK